MKSYDKYEKAGSLSFQLQKYQNSPKYQPEDRNQGHSSIPTQEINVPNTKLSLLESSPKSTRAKSRSKGKHSQKSSTIKLTSAPPPTEPQDEDLIFEQCLSLTSRIENFKKEKYQQVVQEYEEEERKKIDFLFQKHRQQVHQKYQQKRKELKVIYQRQSSRISKGLEDTKKFKEAYLSILQDLKEKKKKLDDELNASVERVQGLKGQLVYQWKRSSNEEILKCLKSA